MVYVSILNLSYLGFIVLPMTFNRSLSSCMLSCGQMRTVEAAELTNGVGAHCSAPATCYCSIRSPCVNKPQLMKLFKLTQLAVTEMAQGAPAWTVCNQQIWRALQYSAEKRWTASSVTAASVVTFRGMLLSTPRPEGEQQKEVKWLVWSVGHSFEHWTQISQLLGLCLSLSDIVFSDS